MYYILHLMRLLWPFKNYFQLNIREKKSVWVMIDQFSILKLIPIEIQHNMVILH